MRARAAAAELSAFSPPRKMRRCSRSLRGDALQLVANDAFVKAIVDKPAVRELVQTEGRRRCWAARWQCRSSSQGQKGDSRALEELISFGQAHSDIFSIHEE